MIITGLLCSLLEVQCKELKCTIWGTTWCELHNKESILQGTQNESYQFTGLSEEEKNDIDILVFYTDKVAFVPSETFTTFPNLDTIRFFGIEKEVLEFNWLNQVTKSFSNQIKHLWLDYSQFKKIDPRVFDIFKSFDVVQLYGNPCVHHEFHKNKGDFEKFEEILSICIHNFETDKKEDDFVITELENDFNNSNATNVLIISNTAENSTESIEMTSEKLQENFTNELKNLEDKIEKHFKELENSNKVQLKNLEDKIDEIKSYLSNEMKKLSDHIEAKLTDFASSLQ